MSAIPTCLVCGKAHHPDCYTEAAARPDVERVKALHADAEDTIARLGTLTRTDRERRYAQEILWLIEQLAVATEPYENAQVFEYPSGNWAATVDGGIAADVEDMWNRRADENQQLIRPRPLVRGVTLAAAPSTGPAVRLPDVRFIVRAGCSRCQGVGYVVIASPYDDGCRITLRFCECAQLVPAEGT